MILSWLSMAFYGLLACEGGVLKHAVWTVCVPNGIVVVLVYLYSITIIKALR